MREALAPLTPPTPRDPSRPKGLNLLGLQAHHPALTAAYNELIGASALRLDAHAPSARAAGPSGGHAPGLHVSVEAARRVGGRGASHRRRGGAGEVGPRGRRLVPVEAALLGAADELVRTGRVADPTWGTLAAHFDTRQVMDVVFTVGAYDLLAMALRTFEIELDDDLRE